MSTELEFVEFAHGHGIRLRRTAYILCRDWHLAEDLAQIALAKLYVVWPRLDWSASTPDAYARKVLYRTFLGQRRRMWSREMAVAAPPDTGNETPADLRLTMLDALSRLPARDRAIVVMRYWDDQSVECVAEALGIKASVVKSQSMRSLAKLREILGDDRSILFS